MLEQVVVSRDNCDTNYVCGAPKCRKKRKRVRGAHGPKHNYTHKNHTRPKLIIFIVLSQSIKMFYFNHLSSTSIIHIPSLPSHSPQILRTPNIYTSHRICFFTTLMQYCKSGVFVFIFPSFINTSCPPKKCR